MGQVLFGAHLFNFECDKDYPLRKAQLKPTFNQPVTHFLIYVTMMFVVIKYLNGILKQSREFLLCKKKETTCVLFIR